MNVPFPSITSVLMGDTSEMEGFKPFSRPTRGRTCETPPSDVLTDSHNTRLRARRRRSVGTDLKKRRPELRRCKSALLSRSTSSSESSDSSTSSSDDNLREETEATIPISSSSHTTPKSSFASSCQRSAAVQESSVKVEPTDTDTEGQRPTPDKESIRETVEVERSSPWPTQPVDVVSDSAQYTPFTPSDSSHSQDAQEQIEKQTDEQDLGGTIRPTPRPKFMSNRMNLPPGEGNKGSSQPFWRFPTKDTAPKGFKQLQKKPSRKTPDDAFAGFMGDGFTQTETRSTGTARVSLNVRVTRRKEPLGPLGALELTQSPTVEREEVPKQPRFMRKRKRRRDEDDPFDFADVLLKPVPKRHRQNKTSDGQEGSAPPSDH